MSSANIRAWPHAFWRTSARTASRIRATCTPRWASGASATAGAAIPPRRRGCSKRCSSAAGCASRAARPASASTLWRKRVRVRALRPRGRPTSWRCCCASTRRCPKGACASSRAWSAAFRFRRMSQRRLSRACSPDARFVASRPEGRASSCLRTKRWIPESEDRVALLAPFDPVVWDRLRFECFWGWDYRFEAYTPPAKRRFGYYALPLLWRDDVIGWANAASVDGTLRVSVGFAKARPRGAAFRRALEAEAAALASAVGAARLRDCRGMNMSVPVLFLIPTLIWGSTWLAITFQLGSVAPGGVGVLSLRARRCRPGGVVCADRPSAALFVAQPRVAGRPGRADDGVQLHLDLPRRAARHVGSRRRAVLDAGVHEPGRDAAGVRHAAARADLRRRDVRRDRRGAAVPAGIAPGAAGRRRCSRHRADAGGDRVVRRRQPDRHPQSSRGIPDAARHGVGAGLWLVACRPWWRASRARRGRSTRACPTCCRWLTWRCSAA